MRVSRGPLGVSEQGCREYDPSWAGASCSRFFAARLPRAPTDGLADLATFSPPADGMETDRFSYR